MAQPSIFFSDASQIGDCNCDNDFDFVFVDKDSENRTNDDDDEDYDDDSYDYCEDVFSIISTSNEEENGNDIYFSSDNIDDETPSRSTGLNDSALDVPLVLLKDLDEAHEAAKLVCITDLNGVIDLVTTCSDDEREIEAEEKGYLSSPSTQNFVLKQPNKEYMNELEHSQLIISPSTLNNDNIDCTGIEDSSSLDVSNKLKKACEATVNGKSTPRDRTIVIRPTAKSERRSFACEITPTIPCFLLENFPKKRSTKKDRKKTICDKNNSKINRNNRETSVPVSISRTSNKKRRKKLKLAKKSQVVEKMHQQAAFANLSSPSQGISSEKLQKHSKTRHHVMPSRCAPKKIANIAVSCAVESM